MASGFLAQDQRPLKKAKLGPPDVYPQDFNQKEDELTPSNLCNGYNNQPATSNEYGSARKNITNFEKFVPEFMSLLAKKHEYNILPDSSKKKQIINTKDNFWPVTARSRNAMEAWFKDLAGNKPLSQLGKRVPVFNKKEEVFSTLCEYSIPMVKAAWLIKMTAIHIATLQENKTKKRQPTDQAIDWTQAICKYLKDQLQKIQEFYVGNSASVHANSISSVSVSSSDMEYAVKQWNYICRLARHMYEEGLIDRHEYLSSLIDLLEKMRQPDDAIMKLIHTQVLQYAEQFSLNQLLARRLAHYCAKKISLMCTDVHCNASTSQPSLTPVSNASMPSSVQMSSGDTASSSNPLVSSFSEYQNCPQHRGIFLTLCAIMQIITLRCPTALVWHSIGEGRASTLLSGSPLDILPCAPSDLPMPPGPQNNHIRSMIRTCEERIQKRSLAVERRWSLDKCQQSATGDTIDHLLTILDMLDRHNFGRSDSSEFFDSLYNRAFRHAPTSTANKDSSEVPVDHSPVINLLLEWAVSTDRTGPHRALVVSKILERKQNDIRAESKVEEAESVDDRDSCGSETMSSVGTPIFQSLLMQFLDDCAPVWEEHANEQKQQAFCNLIHLFSELIRHEIFSHDAYMCTLIARGDLVMHHGIVPVSDGIDVSVMSITSETQSVKPDHTDDIKMDIDIDSMEQYDLSRYLHLDQSASSPYDQASARQDSRTSQSTSQTPLDSSSSTIGPPSRHVYYATHFPIIHDDVSNHESNQRMAVLYGVGRVRDDVRRVLRKITKEVTRLFSRKNAVDVITGSLIKERKFNLDQMFSKFRKLSYHDKHSIINNITTIVVEQLSNFASETSSNVSNCVPLIDNISYLFDLMEHSLCIHAIINLGLQILKLLGKVEEQMLGKNSVMIGTYTATLCLCIVALFRKYHTYLMLSPDIVTQVFECILCVLRHIAAYAEPTSAERCILAYMYDLKRCTYISAKFTDSFDMLYSRSALFSVGTEPSTSNHFWEPEFMKDVIHNPKLPVSSQLLRQLNENEASRYSFVCNALLAVCNSQLSEKLNDISLLCAELTAKCGALSSEWLGVLKALCYSSHQGGFIDILTQIDVSDLSIHDSLAVFTAILISRHCFTLQNLIHLALPSLMAACPSTGGCQDAEPGARLTCHLLLRLFKPSTITCSLSSSQFSNVCIRSSCDSNLLAAAHDSILSGAVLAVLKAMLVLGEGEGESKSTPLSQSGSRSGEMFSSIFDTMYNGNMDMNVMLGMTKKGILENMGLSEYAKHSLREMCCQEWVHSKFLNDPHQLFTPDMLLDSMLSPRQAQQLLAMLCYPRGVPNHVDGVEHDVKDVIRRILRNLDRWSLRLSHLELQLMFKLDENSSESKLNSLLDVVAKGTIELFQQRTAEILYSKPLPTSPRTHSGTEKDGVWLIAPLISKLPSSIQGRILKIATHVLESGNNFSSKVKTDIEKNQKSKCLLSHQPFLSLILMCLKGQDHEKDELLNSLRVQLESYISCIKELLDNSPNEQKIRQDIHEALQLRLSLVGGMLETIQRNSNLTSEWVILLIQLVCNNVLNNQPDDELFLIILDMLCILIQGTRHVSDAVNDKGEDNKRLYTNLIKKLKKEIGDKSSATIDQLRQFIPIPKKWVDVVVCEPYGTVSTKGNKITDLNKKHGHQVSSVAKINPWEVIEGFKSLAPLSFNFFNAVKSERKPIKYEYEFRKLLYHTHSLLQPQHHYLEPPSVPPEETVASQQKLMKQLLDNKSTEDELQQDDVPSRKGRKNRRRTSKSSANEKNGATKLVRKQARQLAYTPDAGNMYPPAGIPQNWMYRQRQPQPQQYYQIHQPTQHLSNPRFTQQSHSKAMLSTMLRSKQPSTHAYNPQMTLPAGQMQPYNNQMMQKRIRQQLQSRIAADGTAGMYAGSGASTAYNNYAPSISYPQGSGAQVMADVSQSGMMSQRISAPYQSAMMRAPQQAPPQQTVYTQQQQPFTNRMSMPAGNTINSTYGQQKPPGYMQQMSVQQQRLMQQQQQHRQFLHMQQQQQQQQQQGGQMQPPPQPPSNMQSQQQQTAAFVAQLERQMSSGCQQVPQSTPQFSNYQQPPHYQ